MTDELTVASYEQIATLLSKLATNYSNLASVFYDVFYDDVPRDITFQMYDEQGVLKNYTIPNRAKDLKNILNGYGSPENAVAGLIGQTYQDLENGKLYIKKTETGTEGWEPISTEEYVKSILIQEAGSPEGRVEGEKGTLYIDTVTATLYIKTTPTGTIGWESITVSTEGFANVNLSNLSLSGRTVFANPDLSNLTYEGENHFDTKFNRKEDKDNKVTSISATSSNNEYPSAKAVYDAIQSKEDISNKVTSISSTSTDTEYPSAKAVYNNSLSAKTLQDIYTVGAGSSVSIPLTNNYSIYKLTPTSNTTITFSNSTSASATKLYTFELYLDMTGGIYSVTWPSNLRWSGGETPSLDETGIYFFAIRTLNGGNSWIGNLQGIW